jgi:ATP-dependent exoDNAse (exonuclease V) beta subunit
MRVRVASAGTGKTVSLVLRALELVRAGTPLRRIAGVTFTRTAAAELRQRVGEALDALLADGGYLEGAIRLDERERPLVVRARLELDGATLTTIHGFMREALALVAPTLGLDPDLRSLGEWEADAIFGEELRGLLYLAREPEHPLHGVAEALGRSALPLAEQLFRRRSLAERFEAGDDTDAGALLTLFDAAYHRFELRLGAGLLPPSEVERRALRLVATPAALRRVAERYPQVLVDEYQDVNPLQGRFFERLEAGGVEIEAVGDPKQSIYGFRNADVEVFRRALAVGVALPPLTATRRHARVLVRFLNRFTDTLAAQGRGFGPAEAPPVEAAGSQAGVRGRLELHWLQGDAPLDTLRASEAALLAERLAALHADRGIAWREMAVLARSYAGLRHIERALVAAGVPAVLLQGRGYYERQEVRDLVHALRVGIEPVGASFAAWLRSPFAQLDLPAVDALLRAEAPLEALERAHPEVAERLERIAAAVRGSPVSALKFLIREPLLAGRRYVDFLDGRARENVDALLFSVAQRPPGDLEILLERLELLSRQADAGDVPQAGEGVQLLTVHRAKGLEWRLVALFDAARALPPQRDPLLIDPQGGALHLAGSPGFERAAARHRARQEAEGDRLLYVALSRARELLLVTGSARGKQLGGWLPIFEAMGLGPGATPFDRPDFVLANRAASAPRPAPTSGDASPRALPPAPWIDRRYPRHPHPPLQSPSGLVEAEGGAEPLPFADPAEGERLPGRAIAVGTLVHDAISRDWSAVDPRHLANLRAQEVMFPFSPSEQDELLVEVAELLDAYAAMLGRELPTLAERAEDHPELPMALPQGPTVWQGVIDRLYRVGDRWLLDDYKTDRDPHPERYHVQLALYLEAVRRVRGVTPQVRLVYLRQRLVVPLPIATLEAAFTAATGPDRT